MKRSGWRKPLYAALVLLYLLHNDLWYWNDPTLVFGLPVGLVYHIGFAVATSIVLSLLVIYAWPDYLEVPDLPPLDTDPGAVRREGGHP